MIIKPNLPAEQIVSSIFFFLELNTNLYRLQLQEELKERYLNSFII